MLVQSLSYTWFNLNQEHFMSFLSVSDYLLACKEEKAREFASYLFTALFEEFTDTYSRQEVLLGCQYLWS